MKPGDKVKIIKWGDNADLMVGKTGTVVTVLSKMYYEVTLDATGTRFTMHSDNIEVIGYEPTIEVLTAENERLREIIRTKVPEPWCYLDQERQDHEIHEREG
jgi:hypothetical protein